MSKDLLVITSIENGYLVQNITVRPPDVHYCSDEAAVAEQVFQTLESIKQTGGRTLTDLETGQPVQG